MRVLFADKLPDRARTRLMSAGFQVRVDSKLDGDTLVGALGEWAPDVLVVRSTKVPKAAIDAGSSLSLIVRAGAGVNTIDLDAASRLGIHVSNTPGKNAVAVAELTFALLLALDRHVAEGAAALRAGSWDKERFSKAMGLKGRRLGVLGMGDIGREVVTRALAFGMEVHAWSRSLTDDAAGLLGVRRHATPEDVARRADVLTLHLALTPETRGLVGDSILSALRPGALLLNTSRAEVLDEAALLAALEQRGLRAGLDVFAGEPSVGKAAFDHPLARHPSVVGSHHIGASTDEAQEAVADEVCAIIEGYRRTGSVRNCVNLAARSAATHVLAVRHRDRVGVLASVLGCLREGALNVQEMDNVLFAGGMAAIARISVAGVPPEAVVARVRLVPDVLAVTVVPVTAG